MEDSSQATSPLRAQAVSIVAFLVTTLTVFLPSTVYLGEPREFTNTFGDLLLVCLCLSTALALLLWLGLFLLRWAGQAWLVRALALLCGLGFLVWLQGNFLIWPYGVLDGRDIPWAAMKKYGYIDGSVWLAVIIAAVFFSRTVVRIGARVSVVLVVVQLVYGGVLFARQPEVPSFKRYMVDERNKFAFSQQKNVIVLVLDSFPTDVFMEIVRTTPRLAAPFGGFTHFRNSLGTFPFTELSVASILTGQYYDNSMPYEKWKKKAFTVQSLPSALKSAGWRVDLFPVMSHSLYYSDEVASNFVKGRPFVETLRGVASVCDIALFRAVPHFLRELVNNDQKWVLAQILADPKVRRPRREAIVRAVSASGPTKPPTPQTRFSSRAYASSVIRFVDAALSTSTLDTSPGTFKFFHWGIPHRPLVLDENLQYRRMETNRRNYVRYATAGIKLVGLFLDHLRALGVYDNSLIFIVGDHGPAFQPVLFAVQPGMRLADQARAIGASFKVAALPLMLVKPYGASGVLTVSDAPVSLIDIPATVFASMGMRTQTQGTSVFSVSETQARDRRFYWYGARDIHSYFGEMTEYIVSGYGWQDTSWRRSGRVLTKNGVVWRRTRAVR